MTAMAHIPTDTLSDLTKYFLKLGTFIPATYFEKIEKKQEYKNICGRNYSSHYRCDGWCSDSY